MFIQFVGQEARDEFVRRFQLQHRGQDEHFGKIKTPVLMSDDLPHETENAMYRYLIAISRLRLGILTERGEGS